MIRFINVADSVNTVSVGYFWIILSTAFHMKISGHETQSFIMTASCWFDRKVTNWLMTCPSWKELRMELSSVWLRPWYRIVSTPPRLLRLRAFSTKLPITKRPRSSLVTSASGRESVKSETAAEAALRHLGPFADRVFCKNSIGFCASAMVANTWFSGMESLDDASLAIPNILVFVLTSLNCVCNMLTPS